MFDKQYKFYGKHAQRVDLLTNEFDAQSKSRLFRRNLDVYINAPLVGFLYGRMAGQDNSRNPETNKVYDQNIMGEQVIHADDELMFNYRLIMLLDEEYEPDVERRIDKAFRNAGKNKDDENRFDEYVRGGVDVLYEKLLEDTKDSQERVDRIYDFIDEFNDRFNKEVSKDDLLNLCGK